MVANDEEAEFLKPLYMIRSGAARGGRLHGIETVTGAFFTLRYVPRDSARGTRPVLQSDLSDRCKCLLVGCRLLTVPHDD